MQRPKICDAGAANKKPLQAGQMPAGARVSVQQISGVRITSAPDAAVPQLLFSGLGTASPQLYSL